MTFPVAVVSTSSCDGDGGSLHPIPNYDRSRSTPPAVGHDAVVRGHIRGPKMSAANSRVSPEENSNGASKADRFFGGSWDVHDQEQGAMGDTHSLGSPDDTKPYSLVTKCLAEFVGDLIFVFIGSMQAVGGPDSITHAAFAHGLTIFILVTSFGHISGGHFNPAVTLAITAAGKMSYLHAPAYMASQLAGGFFGSLFCRLVLGKVGYTSIQAGATLLATGVDWYQGLIAEAFVTFILCNSVLLTAVDTSSNVLAPLAIGFSLTVDIFAAGAITGASMNPARSLGPNLAGTIFYQGSKPNGFWSDHYIYWVGPAIGAIIAAALYRVFYARRARLIK